MKCSDLSGKYYDVCNIINERYMGEYTAFKGGRAPDLGDANWLVNQGVTDEAGIRRFLGIEKPLPRYTQDYLDMPPAPPRKLQDPQDDSIIKIIILAGIALLLLSWS